MAEFDKYEIPVDLDDTEIEQADPELAQKIRNYRDALARYEQASEDCEDTRDMLLDYWVYKYEPLLDAYDINEWDKALEDGVITEAQKRMLEDSGY